MWQCLRAAWLLVVLWGMPTAAQTLPQARQLQLLDQANRAFEQALTARTGNQAQGYYQQAIDAYERLLAGGVHNAKLHYNLGNAYFLRGDLGHAILHYRRGLRLEPGNTRLRANMRYALSQRMDRFESARQHALLPRLFFWHDDLSLNTQVMLALLGFLAAWSAAFGYLWRKRAALLWLVASSGLCFLLFAGSAALVHLRNTATRHGVIVAAESQVRKGNGASYALQFPRPLHAGAEFTVLEERGAWLHVRLENHASGWIRREHAALW